MLRPTVSGPIYLGVKPPSGIEDQIFITLRQSRFVDVGRPLTRGRISCSQLSLALAGAVILGSEYCLRFEISLTWRARSPYLFPPGPEWSVIPSGTGSPFRSFLRLARLLWWYSNPPPSRKSSTRTGTHSSLTVLLITYGHEQHRKHSSSAADHGPLSSYLFRGRCVATGLHAKIYVSE
jgi:hypothetical protein